MVTTHYMPNIVRKYNYELRGVDYNDIRFNLVNFIEFVYYQTKYGYISNVHMVISIVNPMNRSSNNVYQDKASKG